MKELVFATNNRHKLLELQSLIGKGHKLLSLSEIGCFDEIDETADTLEENALLKAKFVFENFHKNCFADDTGLEVEALDGRPGVFSARYSGPGHDFEANIDKILFELSGTENRKACFRTVIALIINGNEYFFEGIVAGKIIMERRGKSGFGYDPVFVPDGFNQTFAEMPLSEKNLISHRAMAVMKLAGFLEGFSKG